MLSPSSLSEGPCVFNDQPDVALAKGSSQCLMEYSSVGERAPSCLFVQDIA